MSTLPPDPSRFARRDLIRGVGAAGLGALVAQRGHAALAPAAPILDPRASFLQGGGLCPTFPSDVQGPYYLDLDLLRTDITEGKQGLPTTFIFQVLRASDCTPVPGVVVDIWHNDAAGDYSGFAALGTGGQSFLRGIQVTDAGGLVFFDSIYPGWYPGRTTHIHLKVIENNQTQVTTQVYFPDPLSTYIQTNIAPYDTKGPSPVKNTTDGFYTPQKEGLWLANPNGSFSILAGARVGI